MLKINLLASICALSACSSNDNKALDPNKDIDCAMIFQHAEINEDNVNATAEERRLIFVFRTWYFQNLSKDRVDEAMKIGDKIKKNPQEIPHTLKACADRAISKSGFAQWADVAGREFQKTAK